MGGFCPGRRTSGEPSPPLPPTPSSNETAATNPPSADGQVTEFRQYLVVGWWWCVVVCGVVCRACVCDGVRACVRARDGCDGCACA